MTQLSQYLDAGDWSVVDRSANPVPGDPDKVYSLASELQSRAQQAGEHASQLSAVRDSNAGTTHGDYAASFEATLSDVPARTGALSQGYGSASQSLGRFAEQLNDIQTNVAQALDNGTQADADYRSALNDFASYVDVPTPDGGGVWRGLNSGSARELATPMAQQYASEAAAGSNNRAAYEEEYQNVMNWASEVGQIAATAEKTRQQAISYINNCVADYQDATSRCASGIRDAVSSLPKLAGS